MKVTDVKETVFNWEQEAWNTGIGGGTGANKNVLVNDVEVDDTGLVYAPTEPGLSYEIDWNLVRRDFVGEIS